jgi:type II secretory ATPase GspE/PulE/Tfp pilus assembly ATPase PilB-like protein
LVERLITAAYTNKEDDNEISPNESEDTLRALAVEARIVRLVNDIFIRAQEMRASDIHVEPESERLVFRFRVDGELIEIMECLPEQYPAIVSRIKLIGGLNIAESRRPQDGRTSFRLSGREFDVRISTVPTMKGESIVLRLLSRDSISFDLAGIGMSSEVFASFEKLINIPHGIILVVGPTGSGKTTTLYSAISRIDSVKRKIITIEDPVEYQFERLSQIPVNPQIGLTFAAGLRHIVRQDPDVILVGEIRDKETADIAINAALTGHLVLSTLHTNDAAGAITRLLDLGVENFLVSSALFGVLSQRLVRIICPDCNGSGTNFNYTGGRCRTCSGTGFKGRTGVYELLSMNEEIRSAVISGKSSTQIAAIARNNGMTTLAEDAARKVAAGITTEQEAARISIDAL